MIATMITFQNIEASKPSGRQNKASINTIAVAITPTTNQLCCFSEVMFCAFRIPAAPKPIRIRPIQNP